MKASVKVLIGACITIAAIAVLLFIFVWNFPGAGEIREFKKQFEQIAIGDAEQTVREILGEPDAVETKFYLGQKSGFEDAYARAAASGSERYLVYSRGVDMVFSVGINKKGEVSVKEYGGT